LFGERGLFPTLAVFLMAQQFGDPACGRNKMQFGAAFFEKSLFGRIVRKGQVFHVY
jgi:hypothetical protein